MLLGFASGLFHHVEFVTWACLKSSCFPTDELFFPYIPRDEISENMTFMHIYFHWHFNYFERSHGKKIPKHNPLINIVPKLKRKLWECSHFQGWVSQGRVLEFSFNQQPWRNCVYTSDGLRLPASLQFTTIVSSESNQVSVWGDYKFPCSQTDRLCFCMIVKY